MQEPMNRIRPSSPLSGQRTVTSGSTRRIWLQLDTPCDSFRGENPIEDTLYNQPTSVDIEVRDMIDDVKSKVLNKLSNTRWFRFKDNTNISLGFYYYSAELLEPSHSHSVGPEKANSNTFVITYSEYQNLIKRNQIRVGRWSQLHNSFNRLLHRSTSQSPSLDTAFNDDNGLRMLSSQHTRQQSQSPDDNLKYAYKVIIEPDTPVMTVYRELYGGLQKSEDALTVFYPPMSSSSPTSPEVLTPAELLDPIRIFTKDAIGQEKEILLSDISQGTEIDSVVERPDQRRPSLFGSFSSSRNNTGILLLPKGVSPEDIEGSNDSPYEEANISLDNIETSPPHPESYALTAQKPLTEEEVGISLTKTISSPELPRPLSRRTTPLLDKQGNLPKYKVFPRINVLIVEDNAINQAILALFLRKNGISYKVAKDGVEAIEKWKEGDSHLILMDLQLPLLSGLEATKKIRELERINNIGNFSQKSVSKKPNLKKNANSKEEGGTTAAKTSDQQNEVEKSNQQNMVLDKSKFRSPVIIVALTASYSQIDRTEALLAGCNDYLTKPVNLDWLSKKITEWGCMQALIDFDGWTEGQRRMTDDVLLRPQIVTARKSQATSTRSVPRVSSVSTTLECDDSKYTKSNDCCP